MKQALKLLMILFAFVLGIAATTDRDKLFEISKNIEIFVNVFKEINTNYVDEIDPSTLMATGIEAMVASLDPYTNFISESKVERYRISDDSRYQGIGAEVKEIEGKFYIDSPLEGGPAHASNLRSGDQILTINGLSVEGLAKEEIEQNIRGVAGSPLRLSVRKKGSGERQDLTLERGEINISNVPYAGMLDADIGYINLTTFTENASANIAKELKKMKRENPNIQGVILDLRGNGGGLLREAIAICNLFLPKGVDVVSTRGKVREQDRSFATLMEPLDLEIPVAVLVNGKSASASEIVSGVIQDMDRGVILGQRSFGKGLVQNTFEIGYNNRVKVTTSKYYIPSGRCIQGVEYEDGTPVDIPDHLRSTFYTANKRPVLDGGGVTPDIKLEPETPSEFLTALQDQAMIYRFANEYELKNDSIRDVESFVFSDYDAFLTFLEKQKFDFQTKAEKEWLATKEALKEQPDLSRQIQAEVQRIEAAIKKDKKQDEMRYKAQVVDAIEKELVSRYFFQKGRTQIGLRNDAEVKEASRVLLDKNRYRKLLNGK